MINLKRKCVGFYVVVECKEYIRMGISNWVFSENLYRINCFIVSFEIDYYTLVILIAESKK